MPSLGDVLREWNDKPLLIKMFRNSETIREREILFAQWIDGFDSHRFKAEPVYSRTGEGYLRSNGVAGYVARKEKREFRAGPEYKAYIAMMVSSLSSEFDSK